MANITQLINNIRNAVFGKDVRESIASAIEQTYEDASEHGNANMEVIDARGGYTVLKNRLDAMLSSINTNYNNIKSNSREIEVNHNDIVSNYSTLSTKINALSSGSPKGTYTNSAAIKTANPDTGVYIATDNGHIYSWTKNQSGDPVDLGVYQATVDSNSVTNIKNKLGTLWGNILPIMNYVDNASIEKGMRYDRLNTNKLAHTTSAIVPPFPVKKGVTYRCNNYLLSNPWSHICDENGNIIETTFPQSATDYHEFTPNKDGYAYLTLQSYNPDTDLTESTMVFIKSHPLTTFIPYNQPVDMIILNESFKELKVLHNTITVGAGKDFNTITSAVASVVNSNKSNVYDIVIDDGTYEEENITLPDYVNLIGASGNRENCIIKGYLSPDSGNGVINPCSTINISKNNELRNLTITAQNMRYPIHDESNGVNKNWKQLVDNCYIEHKGNQEVIDYRSEHEEDPSTVWSSCHAWGEGASSGAYLRISNTTIKSVESAFYVHGASDITKPYYHELINCELIVSKPNEDSSIYVNDTTTPINGNTLVVKDCSLNGRVSIVGTPDYNMIISGSGLHPVYQKPERVLSESDFPIFTDYVQELKANENINKGVFVYTLDGKTIQKANSSTPSKLILGYTIGNHSSGDMVKIMKGYLQPINQTWPETDSLTAGKYYKVGNAGTLVETNNVDEAIAISSTRFYKLFI